MGKSNISTLGFFNYFRKLIGYHFYTFNLLNIFVGLLDGLGLAMFIPLLGMATGTTASSDSMGKLGFLPKFLEQNGVSFNLLTVLIIMLVIFTIKGFIFYLKEMYFIKLRLKSISKVRYNLIEGLHSLSYRGYTESDSGTIQHIMVSETNRLVQAMTQFIKAIEQFVVMSTYVFLAFIANWQFAILVAIGGLLSNLIYKRINKLTRKKSKKLSKQGGDFNGFLIQAIQNFKYLKATDTFEQYGENLKKSINDYEKTQYEIGKLNNIGASLREPLTILIISSVLIIFIYNLGGEFSNILISLLFFYRALTYLVSVQTFWNLFIGNSASLDAIEDFFSKIKKFRESKQDKSNIQDVHSIEVKNGSVNYGDISILKGINIQIDSNQTIALIGESGAGKSTLANVIGGLIDLNKGELLVNENKLEDSYLNEYRKNIGYISQEPVIFDDTIYNNITFWAPKKKENMKRFKNCIELVHLDELLDKLNLKEDSPLGNNGILISGGQKQRISIARELFRDINILIMDEATSALDTETENYIKENIDDLQGQYTMIIIAHRLSTIKKADVIYLMSKGEIIEKGNYAELYSKSEQFRRMVNLQEV